MGIESSKIRIAVNRFEKKNRDIEPQEVDELRFLAGQLAAGRADGGVDTPCIARPPNQLVKTRS